MSKTIWLSKNLSRIAGGTEGFEVDGGNVRECVEDLISMVPAMRTALFYESRLNRTIEVQINRKTINEGDLTERVEDGDEIRILLKGH